MDKSYELLLIGLTKIPPINVPKEAGNGAWGVISGSDSYHASTDASLFSSSLPVLPHEKCRCWRFLIDLYAVSLNEFLLDLSNMQ